MSQHLQSFSASGALTPCIHAPRARTAARSSTATFGSDAIQRRCESDDDPMPACAGLRIDASIWVDVAAAVA
jgi:hypothetical protein